MSIVGAPKKFSTSRRILSYESSTCNESLGCLDDGLMVSSSDSVFGFLDGSVDSSVTSNEGECYQEDDAMFDEDRDEDDNSLEENKTFWDTQQSLLEATLCRTTSLETGIRRVTRETLKELQGQGQYCNCNRVMVGDNCRSCLMREVSGRLRNVGYNATICRTKWRNSSEFPSGDHTFIDVVDNSYTKKGEVRVIVELNFRSDFEMARASNDYNQLINRLPEVFVGKSERLKSLIKILCVATKKCMEDKKIYIGPWRKEKYMQAKWFSAYYESIEQSNSLTNYAYSNQISKPTRGPSLLTIAMMDMSMKVVTVV